MYHYYVKQNPTELYYERHQLLVGQAKSVSLARKAHVKKAQPKSMSSRRAVRAAAGLIVAALMVVGLVLVGSSGPAHAATTFTVTNTSDANNTCDAGCSLREAITAANNTPNSGGPDLIRFNIPHSGVMSIQPGAGLPTITEAVIIDGYTQPGVSRNTLTRGTNAKILIELDGSRASSDFDDGFSIEASGTIIRGSGDKPLPRRRHQRPHRPKDGGEGGGQLHRHRPLRHL